MGGYIARELEDLESADKKVMVRITIKNRDGDVKDMRILANRTMVELIEGRLNDKEDDNE